eukprot:g9157.t1 g9157   contig36:13527-14012(-)
MPPHFFKSSDCQAMSMGQLFDSLLATSINSMCSDNSVARVYSPTIEHTGSISSDSTPTKDVRSNEISSQDCTPIITAPKAVPRVKPPLHRQSSSFRDRKPAGLSISASPYCYDESNPQGPTSLPSPIYCARNVELRRKSLSERCFFRTVSEDDESTLTGVQ